MKKYVQFKLHDLTESYIWHYNCWQTGCGYLLNFDFGSRLNDKLGFRLMLNETLRKCKCSRKFLQNKIKYCFVCNQKVENNIFERTNNYFYNIGSNETRFLD